MPTKVLVVDDSQAVRVMVEVGLAEEEVECLHAEDADQGYWFAVRAQPDLILLDVVLPRASGFELCRALKNEASTAHIPIIFLSGASDPFNKIQGLDLGAIDFISKPFDLGELQARVRAALRTKSLIDALASTAHIDALTKLRNRRFFDTRLNEELASARRYIGAVSLILFDIDHFKRINDELGHVFGDEALKRVADTMVSTAVRETDLACRYGGEEFAIILPDTDLEGAMTTAERVREAVSTTVVSSKGKTSRLTVSCGVASTSQFATVETLTTEALINAADRALYQAKNQGRNRVAACEFLGDGAAAVEFVGRATSALFPPSTPPIWAMVNHENSLGRSSPTRRSEYTTSAEPSLP